MSANSFFSLIMYFCNYRFRSTRIGWPADIKRGSISPNGRVRAMMNAKARRNESKTVELRLTGAEAANGSRRTVTANRAGPSKSITESAVGRQTRATRKAPRRGEIERKLFPAMLRPNGRFGVGVLLAIGRREGASHEIQYFRDERFAPTPGRRPKAALLSRTDPRTAASLLAGLAHPARFKMATAIASGAGTHRQLAEQLKLKTGPLYHHLRSLERAGIVAQASRNLYELTPRGMTALLMVAALGKEGQQSGGWKRQTWRNGR